MQKTFIFFLTILSILNGKEPNGLYPFRPTHFVSRCGFQYSSDLCCKLESMEGLSFMGDFLLKHPYFLNPESRNGKNFDEAIFNYLLLHAKEGDILWVIGDSTLPLFFEEIAPKITKPLIIITAGDPSFPDGYHLSSDLIDKYLENGSIIHIFAENNHYQGMYKEKVSFLPIGFSFSQRMLVWGIPPTQEQSIKKILPKLHKTTDRSIRIFCDFGLNNNGGDRIFAKEALANNGVADFLENKIDRDRLWEIKGGRSFDVSPSGGGQDCHRTWEALALGCIVIVKTSFLDPLYEGLPVVIVQDWSEITEENLQKWLTEYGDVFHNNAMRERLTHKYWMDKIRKIQNDYRSKKASES
jgi:hypothetical protein